MQKEGHKGLTSLERQKPCKNSGGKRQKILSGALPNRRERERERERGKFEKVNLNKIPNSDQLQTLEFSIFQKPQGS